jgi:hypothetical protein
MREKLFRLLQSPWLIALAALFFRVAWLFYKIRTIPAEALAVVPFQNEVGNVAYALSTGHGFCCLFRQPTGPTAWLAPVYPLLIAAIFKLFGVFTFHAFCASVILNSTFSALTCFPLFYAVDRIAKKSTAALAAWLWAVSPIAIILPYAWIWDTSVSAFLVTALLWATLRLADRRSGAGAPPSIFEGGSFFLGAPDARTELRRAGFTSGVFVLYGLLWGISLLTNPALAALLPFLFAWLLLHKPTSERDGHPERAFSVKDLNVFCTTQVRYVLVSVAALLLTLLPWTLRNYSHFHRFIPLRSNFPYEFWSGNNEIFDPDSHAINRITRYEQTTLYAHEGETAFLNEKWQAAKTFVQTHPQLYAQLCARRFVATWFGTDSPVREFQSADDPLGRFLLIWNAASFAAMLVGLIRLYLGGHHYFFPVAIFPAIFPITFYLAHTSLRHRHPIDPAICLLMAFALLGVRNESSD